MEAIGIERLTESNSHYNDLEKMSVNEVLVNINREDATIATVVERVIPQIEALVNAIVARMKSGARMFYIGAGTSGRLGVVDASECPPTFGVPFDLVVGIIAGGDKAIRTPVEHAEDNNEQAWEDLKFQGITDSDVVIGIAASGSTPYVLGGLKNANEHGCLTGSIVCNYNSAIAIESQFSIEVVTGAEFVTGSTRMKAGTVTKMVLNMISTSVMIQLGKVKGNKMVDMRLSNTKLIARGIKMVMNETGLQENAAMELLNKYGSVRKAVDSFRAEDYEPKYPKSMI